MRHSPSPPFAELSDITAVTPSSVFCVDVISFDLVFVENIKVDFGGLHDPCIKVTLPQKRLGAISHLKATIFFYPVVSHLVPKVQFLSL